LETQLKQQVYVEFRRKIEFLYHIGYLTLTGETTTHDHDNIIDDDRRKNEIVRVYKIAIACDFRELSLSLLRNDQSDILHKVYLHDNINLFLRETRNVENSYF
jgi:hypothetical protein